MIAYIDSYDYLPLPPPKDPLLADFYRAKAQDARKKIEEKYVSAKETFALYEDIISRIDNKSSDGFTELVYRHPYVVDDDLLYAVERKLKKDGFVVYIEETCREIIVNWV
jgi:hypothetical protein